MWRRCRSSASLATLVLPLLLLSGCRQDMHDQLKVEPLEASPFYSDGQASRRPVDGTVARGQLKSDRHLHEGIRVPSDIEARALDGVERPPEPAADFPMPVTRELLLRGRERYDVFCAPCHARDGDGDGMVVRRGFRAPPPLFEERLRDMKVGELYDVIRHGRRTMPAYAAQIPVNDRWAIVAYLRVLQLARHASYDDLPERDRQTLDTVAPEVPRP